MIKVFARCQVRNLHFTLNKRAAYIFFVAYCNTKIKQNIALSK